MTNKEKNNKKRNIIIIGILLLLLLCVSLGSAYLSQMLQINGTTNIAKSSWDIHFANEAEQEGSVTAREPLTIDTSKTLITFGVTFTKPGEYYEFEVDTVNDGAMDAMVNRVTKVGISEENAKYISFETTYSDGAPIKQYDLLAQKTSERIKVRVEFKEVDSALDLPSSDLDLDLELQIEYTQSDENAQEREEVKKEPAIIKAGALSFPDLDNKQVKTIILDNKINTPANAIATADFSTEQDGRVIAYIVENAEDTTMYNLHIEGDGSLYANSNSNAAFYGFVNVTKIEGGEILDTSLIEIMTAMFYGMSSLQILDTSSWNLAKVTNLNNTFMNCSKLEFLETSNWNLNNVVNMNSTFVSDIALKSLGDTSSWGLSKLNSMDYTFQGVSSLTELNTAGWDLSNLTSMAYAFNNATSLISLGDTSNWDLNNVTNMSNTFHNCNALEAIDTANWNTSNIKNFSQTFMHTPNLKNIAISNLDFTNATTINNMFADSPLISGTINLNAISLTNIIGVFSLSYEFSERKNEIVINYSKENEAIVEEIISRSSTNEKVIKGSLIEV